jgi:hypothetical protein
MPGFVAADREQTDIAGHEQAFLVPPQNYGGAGYFVAAGGD